MARKTSKSKGMTVTRRYETGYVIAIRFPDSLLGTEPIYVGKKNVWHDPKMGIIGRPESRRTTYHLSYLLDAHIYSDRVDVERELSSVSSFLKEDRNLSYAQAIIESVRWLPREVISTNRPIRVTKKYPTTSNPKLRVKKNHLLGAKIRKPTKKRLIELSRETHERPSQIINP